MNNENYNNCINNSDKVISLSQDNQDLKKSDHGREITGTVIGDRVCISCGYNLVGQSIVREQFYKMLIVRCPECATVASIQEYPLLGKWANRWGAVLALLWLFFLLCLGMILLGTNLTTISWISNNSRHSLSRILGEEHAKWRKTQIDNNLPVSIPPAWILRNSETPSPEYLDPLWWPEQDYLKMINDNESIGKEVRQSFFNPEFIFISLLVAGQGMFLSVMMIHIKRRYLLLIFPLLVISIAYLDCVYNNNLDTSVTALGYYVNNWAWADIIAPVIIKSYVFYHVQPLFFLCFIIGIYSGRKAVRFLLRYLLPPKFLAPFAYLWTAEGLEPPRSFR